MTGIHIRRRNALSFFLLLFCGCAGWASRHWTLPLPAPVAKRVGDALWASCIFETIVILRPRWPTWQAALAALAIAYAIEFGQLYHSSPWLEHLRTTLFGRLVLGSGFSWLDQLAYTVGVTAVAGVDLVVTPSSGHGDAV